MVKVPGDTLSGSTGLRLPSSLHGVGIHTMKTPIRGIPTWPLLSGRTQGNNGHASVRRAGVDDIERAQSSPTCLWTR